MFLLRIRQPDAEATRVVWVYLPKIQYHTQQSPIFNNKIVTASDFALFKLLPERT